MGPLETRDTKVNGTVADSSKYSSIQLKLYLF